MSTEQQTSIKCLFICFHGLAPDNGISKKILAQVHALDMISSGCRLLQYDRDAQGRPCCYIGDEVRRTFAPGLWGKVQKRLDFSPVIEYVEQERIGFVYIRSYHNANPFTCSLVRRLRNSGCRVVMEIPTYPYDQEYITFPMRTALCADRLFRRQLARKLNAIITFSAHKVIFGQKTIQISNGIDFDAIPLRHKSLRERDGTIHLLAVAEIHYWHGFDRLIKGLAIYNKQAEPKRIIFHLVGALTGEREREEILNPVREHELQDQVILHGALWGEPLNDLFDLADFAIGSLGRHRTGIDTIRTLKNREYAARGIPFIYSESDPDFDHQSYVLKALADESPVVVQQIVDFVQDVDFKPQYIRDSIRHLSWTAQMRKVLSSLQLIDTK